MLLVLLVPLYIATAAVGAHVNVDAEAAALPAWLLATEGTQNLHDVDTTGRPHLAEALGRNPWISPAGDGEGYSNRPPGLWLLAVPAYLIAGGDDYSAGPATATAVLLTIAAMLVLHLALRRTVPPWWALAGAATAALGTSAWPIASAQLWPHGPGMLLFSTALLAMSYNRVGAAGLAMGFEVLVRPVAVIAPLAVGAGIAARRNFARATAIALPAAVALGAIVAYNGLTFGRYSLSGGYQSLFRENLVGQSPLDYVGNVILFFISPHNGLFVWSPVVLVAVLGIRRAWPGAPPWSRQAAIAGLVYVIVHARLNRVSGGLPFDYRYQLESLVLAAPILVLSARAVATSRRGRQVLVGALVVSVLLQGLVAFTAECEDGQGTQAECTLG